MAKKKQKRKIKRNPRGRIKDWRAKYREVQKLRKDGLSLEEACVYAGIAYSTFHVWKQRIKGKKK